MNDNLSLSEETIIEAFRRGENARIILKMILELPQPPQTPQHVAVVTTNETI